MANWNNVEAGFDGVFVLANSSLISWYPSGLAFLWHLTNPLTVHGDVFSSSVRKLMMFG